MSLSRKLLLTLLLFAVIPTIFLGVSDYSRTLQLLKISATAELDTLADIEEQRLHTALAKLNQRLVLLSKSNKLIDHLEKYYSEKGDVTNPSPLEDIAIMDTGEQLYLFDRDQNLLFSSTNAQPIPPPLAKTVLENQFNSDLFFDATQGWLFIQRLNVYSKGHDLGYLQHQIKADSLFTPLFQNTEFGNSGEVMLLAEQAGNWQLLHVPRFAKTTPKEELQPLRQAFQSRDRQTLQDYRGQNVITSHRQLTTPHIKIIVKKDRAEILAPAQTLLQHKVAMLLLFAIIALLAARYFSRRLQAPFKVLEDFTAEIKNIDLNDRLSESHRSTELRDFSVAFNHVLDNAALRQIAIEEKMADHLQKLEAEKASAEERLIIQNEFLASMGHNVRAPVNGMLGISTLLANTPLDTRQQEYLRIINRSARALLVTLNDVLDLSKLQAGKLALNNAKFNIVEMAQELIEDTEILTAERDIQLNYEVQSGSPEWLVADSLRIKQMLSNLLHNAAKFTDSGAITLHISAKIASQNQAIVQFCVSDTGVGIPLKKQEAIIDTFSQIPSETSLYNDGNGLGLRIVAKIAQLMEGRAWLESEIEKGSHFYLSLPMAIQKGKLRTSKTLAESIVGGPLRSAPSNSSNADNDIDNDLAPAPLSILIAADTQSNQQILHNLLAARGHRLTLVNDGVAAVKAFEHGYFDKILMDLQMPVMDGLQTAEKIREIEGKTGHPIPIVALTAHALNGQDQHRLSAGMSVYIMKPIDPSLLIQQLEGHQPSKLPESNPWLQRPANEDSGPNIMVLDRDRLKDITRGNQELMRSIAQLFLDELPEMLESINTARSQQDPQLLSQAIHRLKSALGNFVHSTYYQEIAALEATAITAPIEHWEISWQTSRLQLEQLITELKMIAEP